MIFGGLSKNIEIAIRWYWLYIVSGGILTLILFGCGVGIINAKNNPQS